ncbi:MAG: hypothetical protein ACREX3_15095 [Gammaproteobacteria bacterium]
MSPGKMIPWVSMIVAPAAPEQETAAHLIVFPTTNTSPAMGPLGRTTWAFQEKAIRCAWCDRGCLSERDSCEQQQSRQESHGRASLGTVIVMLARFAATVLPTRRAQPSLLYIHGGIPAGKSIDGMSALSASVKASP